MRDRWQLLAASDQKCRLSLMALTRREMTAGTDLSIPGVLLSVFASNCLLWQLNKILLLLQSV